MSHFFAYLARMRLIKRWGLMRSVHEENLAEHSLQVALVAHALAVIRRDRFQGAAEPERVAFLALFHDAAEVLTGDLVSPIKHHNRTIAEAFGEIEGEARRRLVDFLPPWLRAPYEPALLPRDADAEAWDLIHAADKISAYVKCVEELAAGNREFAQAKEAIERQLACLPQPEVKVFLDTFAPSFALSLDELSRD